MILVSACLCGINTKYNGENNLSQEVLKLIRKERIIPICPEQLGGLTTPREPCEIRGGTGGDVLDRKAIVVTSDGKNVTDNFLRGAYETLNIAKAFNIKKAILKSKSPSCGYNKIYDGSFKKNIIKGNGVTAELLIKNGIKIYTEGDISSGSKV
ncbi:DUF523 domain-containing protein [Clostridium kluyveri]|uniref:DUF523 domain-containing protein n=1 Tax=Clostridium kluyveri TaxID=1534 RepID=UPI002246A3EB|nr:DUF523 domain-containing protein [Clostridium kluyveri]UZQ49322.1 DUF523 domain-containing protein [Clostridium kluyveri]